MARLLVTSIVLVTLVLTTVCAAGLGIFNSVKITKLYCNFNPDWVQNGTCKLKAVSRTRHEVTIKGFLTKPMNEFWVNVNTYKLYNVYRPFIHSFSANLCDFYRQNAKKDIILINAIDVAQAFTNLNHSCPYEGWVMLEKGLFMKNYAHTIIPPGKYKADVKISYGKNQKPVLQGQIFVDVVEDTEF